MALDVDWLRLRTSGGAAMDDSTDGAQNADLSRLTLSIQDVLDTTIALIVHELATNSLKYGALSVDTGTLDVSCSAQNEAVTLIWTENGGPPVSAPTKAPGYGTRLIERSLAGALRASIAYDWETEGGDATLKIDPARLAL